MFEWKVEDCKLMNDPGATFSEWFEIIPKEEAERKWYLRELDFCVLRRDGSDCYADCYDTFGEIPEDALFGIEKDKTGGTR